MEEGVGFSCGLFVAVRLESLFDDPVCASCSFTVVVNHVKLSLLDGELDGRIDNLNSPALTLA